MAKEDNLNLLSFLSSFPFPPHSSLHSHLSPALSLILPKTLERDFLQEKSMKRVKSNGMEKWRKGGRGDQLAIYQELWGTEDIQCERLDPGVVDSQLPVDSRALDAGEDAQVGGQPRRVWKRGESSRRTEEEVKGEKRKKCIWVANCPQAKATTKKSHFCSMWANFVVSLWKAVSSGNVITPWVVLHPSERLLAKLCGHLCAIYSFSKCLSTCGHFAVF